MSRKNELINIIRNLGLFNCRSQDKFVPDCFKFNLIEVRHSILQGLLDTDGHVSTDGKVSITTVSPKLSEDIKFLVQSLGGTVSIKISKRIGKRDCFYMSIVLSNNFIITFK